jgi:hypothetical protein
VARLRAVRDGLTGVQRRFAQRVRLSAWAIAGLFIAALVCLELHIELADYGWSGGLVVAYVGFASGAIAVFLGVSNRGWQPISEDYRAIAEALRIQIMFWECGYDARSDRVDLMYLRGLHGSLGWIREAIGHLVAAAKLLADPPRPDHAAAGKWIAGQIAFFEKRIARRSSEMRLVRTATWFLFVMGLMQAIALSEMQLFQEQSLFHHLAVADADAGPPVWQIAGAGVAIVLLFLLALNLRRAADAARRPRWLGALRAIQTLTGVAAGLVLAMGLWRLGDLMPQPEGYLSRHPWLEAAPEKLMMLALVLPAAFAGALRFVADKLSWEAEMQGYERAVIHFRRADQALAELEVQGHAQATRRRRQMILVDLAAEALRENEAWLVAHRERPLEPVVGG